MGFIKAELHCHNSFSNFHVGEDDAPFDCDITIPQQLERAYALGLDAFFITNHNTLDGYSQILQYKNNHTKYKHIQIFKAEEITTNTGAHVIAYGIHKEIPAGLPLEEIVDEIRKQDGVSCAPHPFSLLDALRDDAKKCDLIEVFNSNNIQTLMIGGTIAFIVALLSVKFFIQFVQSKGFRIFGWYRIAIAIFIFGLLFSGIIQ